MATEEIIIYALVGVVSLLLIWVISLEIRFKRLPSVKSDRRVNERLKNLEETTSVLNSFKDKTELDIISINNEIRKTIQGIETIRFNPFKKDGIGGNQSFATALIDKDGNGVILSSLYSRERVSVFAKPINNWNSEHKLSDEEREVLNKARENKSNKAS